MNRKFYRLVGLAVAVAVLSGSLAWSLAGEGKKAKKVQEQKVTLEQLPAAVKATIQKEAGQNKIREIEKITRGDKQCYEAEWVADGKEIEVKVGADGKLLGKEVEKAGKDDEDEDDDDDKAKPSGESERKVTEAEVPAAALKTLKRMARGAAITEFAEEVEHGATFYEGSWKGRSGQNVDVLVTAAGALVEIERQTGADQVPAAVLAAAKKAAGKDAKMGLERKMMVLYEIHFKKDGRTVELLLTPDGRRAEEPKQHHDHDRDGHEDDED